MASEENKILGFNQFQKFDEALFMFANLQYTIEKTDGCKNNLEHSCKTKVSEYTPSGFSMSTMSSFGNLENKHDVYRGNDCRTKFCEFLKEHAMKIIGFKKKKKVNY